MPKYKCGSGAVQWQDIGIEFVDLCGVNGN